MYRVFVPLLLLVLVAFAGCDNGGSDASASDGGAEDASASPRAEDPSGDPEADDGAEGDPEETRSEDESSETSRSTVTTEAFCDGIHPVLVAGDGEQRGRAAMDLLSEGLPEAMPDDARQGLQVLVDLSPYFDDTRELFRSYYALGSEDKRDVHALAGFVMRACGADLIAELTPTLPDDLISELPSDLASLLPS